MNIEKLGRFALMLFGVTAVVCAYLLGRMLFG